MVKRNYLRKERKREQSEKAAEAANRRKKFLDNVRTGIKNARTKIKKNALPIALTVAIAAGAIGGGAYALKQHREFNLQRQKDVSTWVGEIRKVSPDAHTDFWKEIGTIAYRKDLKGNGLPPRTIKAIEQFSEDRDIHPSRVVYTVVLGKKANTNLPHVKEIQKWAEENGIAPLLRSWGKNQRVKTQVHNLWDAHRNENY